MKKLTVNRNEYTRRSQTLTRDSIRLTHTPDELIFDLTALTERSNSLTLVRQELTRTPNAFTRDLDELTFTPNELTRDSNEFTFEVSAPYLTRQAPVWDRQSSELSAQRTATAGHEIAAGVRYL